MQVITVFMAIYFGLAPVFWWPSIAPDTLLIVKSSLIVLFVSFVWVKALLSNKIRFPSGLLGPVGLLCLFVVSCGGFYSADIGSALSVIKDFSLCFIMLWTFYIASSFDLPYEKIFFIAALVVAIHCVLVDSSYFFGFPNWRGPSHFVAPQLSVSGFGALRTGWSNGVSLFVPFLCGAFFFKRTKTFVKVVALFSIVMIITSQIIVAGRAGLIASLISLVYLIYQKKNKLGLFAFFFIALFLLVEFSDYFITLMRVEPVASHGVSTEFLDDVSAGRLSSGLFAIKMASKKMLFGYGFGNFKIHGMEVHNLWLRLFVEGGIFLPALFIVILLLIMRNARKLVSILLINFEVTSERDLSYYYVLNAVLIAGFFISLFEPRALLGSFQTSSIWWASAGVVLAQNDKRLLGTMSPVRRTR